MTDQATDVQTTDAQSTDAQASDEPDAPAATERLDVDAVRRDLDDVQTALVRLDDGTYWTDEVTGAPIPDDVLEARPLTRRAPAAMMQD